MTSTSSGRSRPGKGKRMIAQLALRGYLALPLPLRRAVPDSLRLRVRNEVLPVIAIAGPGGKAGRAAPIAQKRRLERLDALLWGGYSRAALPAIAEFILNPRLSAQVRADSAWALARWYGAQGDPVRAYENLAVLRILAPTRVRDKRFALLAVDCLRRLGRTDEARVLAETGLRATNGSNDLRLALANCALSGPAAAPDPEADGRRLEQVNAIFRDSGLEPLRLRDPAGAFALDNLVTDAVAPVTAAALEAAGLGPALPKVSVILPVHAAAETLPFALRSLLAQSWANLELIVVDDRSPDDTVAVAEAIAATDPRVRVLRQDRNAGSYAARNAGLRVATGDYITTHDADDWSHPRKIEQQVRAFLEAPDLQATYSDWVRCSADMVFRPLFRPWSGLISKNISSLMFRRAAMERLGGWVEVRVGADTELLRRAEILFGGDGIRSIAPRIPLAFGLHAERSLTRASATHVRTAHYGIRKELNDASLHWHAGAATPEALRIDPARNPRPFPVPAAILPERRPVDCDLLFIADCAMVGGAFVSTFNYIQAAIAAGRSVAVFHWRRRDLDINKPIQPVLRDLAAAGKLQIVAAGERVRAGTTIVGYPVILREVPDLLPEIDTDALVVVVNQMASRLHGGGDPQYDPEALRATCRQAFGTEGTWVPISGLVQRLMREDRRYPAPSATIWTPLIDIGSWTATAPRWRGAGGAQPVIGRHARDHYTKWPAVAADLAAAYCADRPARVELMGGADKAIAVLGRKPANWTVLPFGSKDSRSFLSGLDAFIHYPQADYIEEFGRAVLEALALGLPAVLPPVFRDTFGAAALYAEPAEVWPTLARLWADEAAWIAQGQRGQDFVRASSDWTVFPDRLRATLGPAPQTVPQTAPAPAPAPAPDPAAASGLPAPSSPAFPPPTPPAETRPSVLLDT